MAEFTFEIEEHLLTLSENEKGWTKEINRVSFNGAPAKFDIRSWSPDHTKMGKGITLSNEEFQSIHLRRTEKRPGFSRPFFICLKNRVEYGDVEVVVD